ncbi:Isotrichodermin C-15 hydroxylase [Sphaceloma murrayae]|uniref:Isotrichodermin C-15 hydroxylase n=1 Tax=Sphaceloma murrayae TaxID=2082308 RepID=A0A2K1QRK6_9PEZI|nr:Isotrichodermin C-15 hydroxylase [Sphaceloma murrayae]
MALFDFLPLSPLPLTLTTIILLLAAYLTLTPLLSPLSSLPGPLSLRFTPLPLLLRSYLGTESTYLTALCAHYDAPILLIGPNEVLISDGAALAPIYSTNGGFAKAPCYRNFDIMGWPSLFSALDKGYRAPRAKAVVGMFATKALREGEARVREAVVAFVERLRRERDQAGKGKGGRVELLDASRALAVDAVTGYLFGKGYGGLQEGASGEKLSASEFVNAFVGVGRFFFLPNWAFVLVERASQWMFETRETVESMQRVEGYVRKLVEDADVNDATYQARLLKSGLTKDEIAAQCMDLMFAGTDSSGMNMSTFCWQMAKHPEAYAKLKAEILQSKREDPNYDPATLPYLRACIKETLRLSMANPTRLPRVVPDGGWLYTPSDDFSFSGSRSSKHPQRSYFLPAGTLVSCQIHTLHHNPSVFPKPFEFEPERWMDSSHDLLDKMTRDFIPFSLGSRQCIARNLAMAELNLACAAVIESGVLDGAKNVGDRIEILEWFNSKVEGERIEIEYP